MKIDHRIEWIDICKGITIYLMVLCHVGTSKYLDTYIHAFHMPIFFILSGYCFNEVKNANLIKMALKRLRTLIVPYISFGVGLYLFWNVVLYILKQPNEMEPVQNLISSLFGSVADYSVFGVIQWFLPCLFLTEIMFVILLKFACKSVGIMCVWGGVLSMSIIGWLYPHVTHVRPFWAFDCALMATAFYGLGWLLKKNNLLIELNKRIFEKSTTILLLFIVCISISTVYLNGYVNMRVTIYGNYLLYVLNAIGISLLVIVIAMIMEKVFKNSLLLKVLIWTGKNTLIILLLNTTFIKAWEVVFGNIMASLNQYVLYIINALVALLVTLCGAMASEFINKYMPWLVGKSYKK